MRKSAVFVLLAGLAGCNTISDAGSRSIPAVLEGTPTGVLEFVNTANEEYGVALNRCGEENQNRAVNINGKNAMAAGPGQQVRATLSTGCYTAYVGPNRMSNQIRTVPINLPDATQSILRLYPDGRTEPMPVEGASTTEG